MMIKNKHRGLYKSMMKGRKRRENEAKIMEKKRKAHDEEEVAKKKAKKVFTLFSCYCCFINILSQRKSIVCKTQISLFVI